jgi:phage tail-like protein
MKRIEIERLLPEVFRRTAGPGTPLAALLEAMQALHEPVEEVLAHLETFFDPYQAPDEFVFFLARWVDLERLFVAGPHASTPVEIQRFPSGLGQLRELIASAAFLSKWRGTARGLLRFLETATGVPGFEIVENAPGPDGRPRPFHLSIHAPASAESWLSASSSWRSRPT